MRRFLSGLALLVWGILPSARVLADSWADKLFEQASYDFGTIPGGMEARYTFVVKNVYGEPVRIAGFTIACGCTEVRVGTKRLRPRSPNEQLMLPEDERIVLRPGESIEIELALDTRRFVGQHKSTSVTVHFDQPSYTTTRLTVSAYIRQDVVVNPGAVVFGPVLKGQSPSRSVDVEYAGGFDWRITEIQWNGQLLDVTATELYRKSRRVGYRITVTLKPNLPPGPVRDRLLVRTNESSLPELEIPVEGVIQSTIAVTPQQLGLGTVRTGEEVVKQILVRGPEPFRIRKVTAGSDEVQVEFDPEEQKTLHTIKVRFKPASLGLRQVRLEILTDVEGESPLACTLHARVEP